MLCTLVGSAGISVSLASVFVPDIWATPTHWDVALLAVIAIVVAVAINLLSGGFVNDVLSVLNVALYLTYGSTCVAVLIAHRRGSIPDAPPGYFSLGRWLVPITVTCVSPAT